MCQKIVSSALQAPAATIGVSTLVAADRVVGVRRSEHEINVEHRNEQIRASEVIPTTGKKDLLEDRQQGEVLRRQQEQHTLARH